MAIKVKDARENYDRALVSGDIGRIERATIVLIDAVRGNGIARQTAVIQKKKLKLGKVKKPKFRQ